MNDKQDALDNGPFFHGTKAELKTGDLLVPQQLSNYQLNFRRAQIILRACRCSLSR